MADVVVMNQQIPCSLRECLQEIREKIGSRNMLLRYVRSIPLEKRRQDHQAFERRLLEENHRLEDVAHTVFAGWQAGQLSLAHAAQALRATIGELSYR